MDAAQRGLEGSPSGALPAASLGIDAVAELLARPGGVYRTLVELQLDPGG